MKNKTLFILLFLLAGFRGFGQVFSCYYYEISFEGTGIYENDSCHWLYNDTISNPANIWQIGPPQKTNLSAAYSNPNVIITDTINSYPVNDTSSFILGHLASLGLTITNQISLTAKYKIHSDTLTDYGNIEFSPDNGLSWIDLFNPVLTCSTCYVNVTGSPAPVLSGNSGGWQELSAYLWGLNPTYNIQEGDTVLWRFSFRSDGVETFKDGLMYDSIYVIDAPPVSIKNEEDAKKIDVYPNPFSSTVMLSGIDNGSIVKVFNILGESVYALPFGKSGEVVEIDLTEFKSGIYFIQIQTEKEILTRKIVKK